MNWRLKTREQVEAELSHYNAAIDEAGGDYGKAAIALGIVTRKALANRVCRLRAQAERGEYGTSPIMPTFAIKSVSTQIGPNGETQKEWIKQGPQAGEAFAVPEGHTVKGISALVDGAGRTIQQWVKTKSESSDFVIDALKTTFEQYKGRAKPVPPPKHANDDLLTVYPIGDFHAGLYSWSAETGEDWDLSIAERVLRGTMADLVSSAPASETGLVLSLGDFFHMDDASNRTPASGHALDVDTRRAKVLQVGVQLLIDCIEMALAKHRKVIVRCLAGNHDPATTPALNIALWAFFNKNDRVFVDCSPSKFFYHQFGKVMIAATHGDMCKMADLPGVMASSQPSFWGISRFRYGYTGHIHHKSQVCKEINGVICESFQVLPPSDAWHSGMGFGSGRSMQAITHHRETGEKFRHIVSIVPNR
jgi:hypothetical protein